MKNIVLIGFMGTGKTSTGRLLSSRIGYSFVDTDYRIEQAAGMTVAEMFAQYGESYFREKETEMIQRVARYRQAVISTGGGVVLQAENMKALRQNGLIVSLHAEVDVILERTGRRNIRPLLQQKNCREVVLELLKSRRALYDAADLCIDTSVLTPLQVVGKIIDRMKKEGELRA